MTNQKVERRKKIQNTKETKMRRRKREIQRRKVIRRKTKRKNEKAAVMKRYWQSWGMNWVTGT